MWFIYASSVKAAKRPAVMQEYNWPSSLARFNACFAT
jgi:hypothetical protein